ncbi:MAG: hypothetical protein IT445_09690 [Phycisphaeraceae bacterium]|nr:hypothetical protein [Phycisphaeraceae bacterium]
MAEIIHILWSDQVIEHMAEHGVTVDEADQVLRACFDAREPSAADSGRWIVKGFTPAGRFLVVVFDDYPDLDLVVGITAYEPEH